MSEKLSFGLFLLETIQSLAITVAPKFYDYCNTFQNCFEVADQHKHHLKGVPQPLPANDRTFLIAMMVASELSCQNVATQNDCDDLLTRQPSNHPASHFVRMGVLLFSNILTTCLPTTFKGASNMMVSFATMTASSVWLSWLSCHSNCFRSADNSLRGCLSIREQAATQRLQDWRLNWSGRTKTAVLMELVFLVLSGAHWTTTKRMMLTRTPTKKHRIVSLLKPESWGPLLLPTNNIVSHFQAHLVSRMCGLLAPTIQNTSTTFLVRRMGMSSLFFLDLAQSFSFQTSCLNGQQTKTKKTSRLLVGKNGGAAADDWIPNHNPATSFCSGSVQILSSFPTMQLGSLSKLSGLMRTKLRMGAALSAFMIVINQLKRMGRSAKLSC